MKNKLLPLLFLVLPALARAVGTGIVTTNDMQINPNFAGSSVTASSFWGDGSHLSGVVTGAVTAANVTAGSFQNAGYTFPSTLATTGLLTASGGITLGASQALALSGGAGTITTVSSVTASAFFGDASHLTALPAAQVTAGSFQNAGYTFPSTLAVTGALSANGGLTLTNVAETHTGTAGTITTASSVTASAFFGDGSHLTGITASAVTAANVTAGSFQNAGYTFPNTLATTGLLSANGGITLGANQAVTLSGNAGNVTSASSVTASAFFGDGSHLNGVTAGITALTGDAAASGSGSVAVTLAASQGNVKTFTAPLTAVSSMTYLADVQAAGSTVTFNASQTINWQTQGPRVTIVVTANTTSSTWSNAAQRGVYTLTLVQGGAGSFTYVWPSNIVWPNKGAAPTLSTAVGARDYFSLFYDTDLNFHVLAEALNN